MNQHNNKSCVIILPGRGYKGLVLWNEGFAWCHFFENNHIAPAILLYQMPNGNYRKPLRDISEAIRFMRSLGYANVGVMGSSAGGHLAASLLKNVKDTIEFAILMYPVISMTDDLAHVDSRSAFLGDCDTSSVLKSYFSFEDNISDATPPCFIGVSRNDSVVNPQNSYSLYYNLMLHNRPAALYVYPTGGHGWGFDDSFEYHNQMKFDLSTWLYSLKLK